MDEQNYLDFDLQIESTNLGFRSQVLNSPAGKATSLIRWPFSNDEFTDFLASFEASSSFATPDYKAVQDFGRKLFNAVFSGEVQVCLDKSLSEASLRGAGLRLRFHSGDEPQFAAAPWEYLYHPYLDSFVAFLQNTSIVRYVPQAELNHAHTTATLPVELPLRVLTLVSEQPQTSANFGQAWQQVEKTLQELERGGLIKLEQSTLAGLEQQLQANQYHILHFGGYNPFVAPPTISLEAAQLATDMVSAEQLVKLLQNQASLRLVVFQVAPLEASLVKVAQTWLTYGLPAVITLPFETTMTENVVKQLVTSLYKGLTQGQPLDSVMSDTRKKLFQQGDDLWWGRTGLFLSSDNARVFEVAAMSQAHQIFALYEMAKAALEHENWDAATTNLNSVLSLDANQSEAQTLLEKVGQQQKLADLYRTGREHYEAKRWTEALEAFHQIAAQASDYKDVKTLLEYSEDEFKQSELAQLQQEAHAATEKGQWDLATEKLQRLLVLNSAQAGLRQQLEIVQQQQGLANLYAKGQEHYAAGRWCEALEVFQQLYAADNSYKDIRTLVETSEQECQRSQITSWLQEAHAAGQREEWATAITKLQHVLKLNPLQFDAQDYLAHVQQQQELARLYDEGQRHFEAHEWEAALDCFRQLETQDGHYKAVSARLEATTNEIAAAQKQAEINSLHSQAQAARQQGQWSVAAEKIAVLTSLDPSKVDAGSQLHAEAQAAAEQGDWATTIAKLTALLDLDPAYPDLNYELAQAKRQQELANLYTNAHQQYDSGNWYEALKAFRLLQQIDNNYKDVNTLIAAVESRREESDDTKATFLNFDLEIEGSSVGYHTQVSNSPAGRAVNVFRWPFGEAELADFLANFNQTTSSPEKIALDLETIQKFGWRLFNAAFGSQIQSCLDKSLTEASQQGLGLRLRLQLNDDPQLNSLPWEYLYHPYLNSFLSFLHDVTLVRYQTIPAQLSRKPILVELPLRVLVIPSQPAAGDLQADLKQEWAELQSSLAELIEDGLVKLEQLEVPTLIELRQQLQLNLYHVLHFSGYSAFSSNDTDALLRLTDGSGHVETISNQQLAGLLREHGSLGLVVFNVAQFDAPVSKLSQSLVQQGVPAVVTLPPEIIKGKGDHPDSVANQMLLALYNSLTQSQLLDVAVSQARQVAFEYGDDMWWGRVELYFGSESGRVFEVAPLNTEQQVAALLRAAHRAVEREDWEVADQKLTTIVNLDPTQVEANQQLAQVRQHLELEQLYAKGQEYYAAGRWSEAVNAFQQLTLKDGHYRDANRLLETSLNENKRKLILGLKKDAQEAREKGEWEVAIEKLETILALDPTQFEVSKQLSDAHRQQDLVTLYAEGQQHYRQQQWTEALEAFQQLAAKNNAYKDVKALLADVGLKVAEETRKAQVKSLYAETQQAVDEENWQKVADNVEAFRVMNPPEIEAANTFSNLARQRQEAATLHLTALEHYKAGYLQEALDYFKQVHTIHSGYKNVQEMINHIEATLTGNQTALPLEVEAHINDQMAQSVKLPKAFWSAQRQKKAKETGELNSAPPNLQPVSSNADLMQVQPSFLNKPIVRSGSWTIKRLAWFLLIGWWLGLLGLLAGYLLSVSIVFLPLGMSIFNQLPHILTRGPALPSNQIDTIRHKVFITNDNAQYHLFVRIFYFLLIGWWLTGLWCLAGYVLSLLDFTLPLGLTALNRLPWMLILQRSSVALPIQVAPTALLPNPYTRQPYQPQLLQAPAPGYTSLATSAPSEPATSTYNFNPYNSNSSNNPNSYNGNGSATAQPLFQAVPVNAANSTVGGATAFMANPATPYPAAQPITASYSPEAGFGGNQPSTYSTSYSTAAPVSNQTTTSLTTYTPTTAQSQMAATPTTTSANAKKTTKKAPKQKLPNEKDRTSFWVKVLVVVWSLVPITLFIMLIINNILSAKK